MLAIKATYDNGKIHWPGKPPIDGLHNLIVVFEDVNDPLLFSKDIENNHSADGRKGKASALTPLPELDGRVSVGWKEAIYGS